MPEHDLQRPYASDRHTHVFILRIWIEPREIGGAVVEWRGVIEHLPTQERLHLNDLAAIVPFITPYLVSMGVRLTASQRVQQWFNGWKR